MPSEPSGQYGPALRALAKAIKNLDEARIHLSPVPSTEGWAHVLSEKAIEDVKKIEQILLNDRKATDAE